MENVYFEVLHLGGTRVGSGSVVMATREELAELVSGALARFETNGPGVAVTWFVGQIREVSATLPEESASIFYGILIRSCCGIEQFEEELNLVANDIAEPLAS